MREGPEGAQLLTAISSTNSPGGPGASGTGSGTSSSGGVNGGSGPGATGSAASGTSGNSGPNAGLGIDPGALLSPVAVVSAAASTYDKAYGSLVEMVVPGALDLGDPQVESAWSAFQSAWISEVIAAESALSALLKLVPGSVGEYQNTDQQGGAVVSKDFGGAVGPVGGSPTSGPVGPRPPGNGGRGVRTE
ncbi:hypothetical protein ABIA39_006075 [Nocardia sp. GAS34]|uniref:hypothetical protein n=1 Tax=unclassified Nocardia TaxID=2637762 RepID=UPI003D24904E